jgi:hypothetical protein
MHHIVYLSTATVPLAEHDLQTLLQQFRANNARLGVTGILLYSDDGRFMQVVEGEQATLRALYAKIQDDSRHRGLLTLADGPIARRHFSTWLMGFKVEGTAAFRQLAGYVDPESPAFRRALTTPDVLIRGLLETFASESVPNTYAD